MRSDRVSTAVLAFSLLLPFAGCGAVKAPITDPARVRAASAGTVLDGDGPSESTRQVLRLYRVAGLAESDPDAAIRVLAEALDRGEAGSMLAEVDAIAELAILRARDTADEADALASYLCAAAYTYDALRDLVRADGSGRNPLDPRPAFTAELYGASTARVVSLMGASNRTEPLRRIVDGPTHAYTVAWDLPDDFPWSPDEYDFVPADGLEIRGLENHYRVPGLGAPVVARRRGATARPSAMGGVYESYRERYGLTALVETGDRDDGDAVEIALRLLDPLDPAAELGGVRAVLAEDRTAALALAMSEVDPERFGERGMFRPAAYLDLAGLYVPSPYREDRIPLLFVHGLGATAGTFAEMVNDLFGDDEIRARYQPWFFNYPSGLTFGYSSVLLERSLNEARLRFDPDGDDANLDRMVVVAHSMGGLMTRLLITADRSRLYDAFFTVPLESLDLEPADAAFVRELFESEPDRRIERVVFLATPHRGAPMAAGLLGRAGSAISSTPDELRQRLRRIVTSNPGAVTPVAEAWSSDGIEALAPETSLMEALEQSPMVPDVILHSILGHGRKGSPGPGSDDGVVPYWSAHLDPAVSEISVPSNHIVHDDPEAIAEVERILREHLRSSRN